MASDLSWRQRTLDYFKDYQIPILKRLETYLEIKKFSGSWLHITAQDLGISELDLHIELLKDAHNKGSSSLFKQWKQHSLVRCSCKNRHAQSFCRTKLVLTKYAKENKTIFSEKYQRSSIH